MVKIRLTLRVIYKHMKVIKIPSSIDPFRFAANQRLCSGQLQLKDLPRLKDLVQSDELIASFELQFAKDDQGLACITGRIDTSVDLLCQRCGQIVQINLNLSPCLAAIFSDKQAPSLPEQYEPLVTKGEPVMLAEVIEDEILLNLPMIAKHPLGQCPTELPTSLQ